MKRRWVSIVFVLSLAGCDDSSEREPSHGSGGGGAAGSGASATTGGAGGAGGSSGAGASSSGGTAGSAGASGSGGGSLECNEVPADAPDYEVVYDSGPAPAGKGGAVLDGTYFATSETWFDMAPGPSVTLGGIRLELDGRSWEEANGWPTDDVVNPEYRVSRYFTTEGTSLVVTELCPLHNSTAVFEYTAEGDALIVYVREGSLTYAVTFTRQP
jgi:hypothetical protein